MASGGAPAPATIGAGTSVGSTSLAVDGRGDALATWGTSMSTAQGRCDPPAAPSPSSTTFADPTAGVSVAGTAIDRDAHATIALARRGHAPLPFGGVGLVQGTPATGWDAPQWLDPSANVRQLTLAANSAGALAALWDTQPDYDPDRPGVARIALCLLGQPFGVVAQEVEPLLRPRSYATTDTANDAVLTGGGETLALWSGGAAGVTIHPLSAAGERERAEPLPADACNTGGAVIAAGAGAQAAALFIQRRGLWIAYRAAGTAARPRPPRICSLIWASANSSHASARARGQGGSISTSASPSRSRT